MIFINNKYTTIYYQIIDSAISRNLKNKKEAKNKLGYIERHHIIPQSLGGTNTNNTVFLTAREHFICHRLLVKMTTGNNKNKMIHALAMMLSINNHQNRIIPSSRVYAYIRTLRMNITGEKHHNYGKRRSDDWKTERSSKYTGEGNPNFGKRYKIKDTTNYNNKRENNPMYGKSQKECTKNLISEKRKLTMKVECPHCNIIVDICNYGRWHGNKCKQFHS